MIVLNELTLKQGVHTSANEGACVMEAVSYFAGEPWSDHPTCVSPVIAAFLRRWNDDLGEADRNRLLKPYVLKVIGTNTGKADDERRAWMATDWIIRTYLPAWLRVVKLDEQAVAVESLAALVDLDSWNAAKPTVFVVKEKSTAARDAARDAAWAAAGDAAWATAMAAASTAARATAGAAARAAAGAAARAAAWAAARDAAWDAAGAAAGAAVKPTIASLQQSACDLLDRMIAVGKVTV